MKHHALIGSLSLLLAGVDSAPRVTPLDAVLSGLAIEKIPEAASVSASVSASASAPASAPVPASASVSASVSAPVIRAVVGLVPADLSVEIRAAGDSGFLVRARRKGHLVSIRTAARRAASAGEASLTVDLRDSSQLVWETTRLDSLATTRGLIQIEAPVAPGSAPRHVLSLAEAPARVGREERAKHRCDSYEDGFGGFTVLCRVDRPAEAESLAGDDPTAGIAVARGSSTVVRLDFPAARGTAEARVIGYAEGREGHVIRAEASFLPGEARPTFAIFSSARQQPIIPFKPRRYFCCRF